jgi:16S rRNA (guanine527-N7)-methyltransferase
VEHPGLRAYADLVRVHADRLDLVSSRDLRRFEERHVADSLRLLPLLERLPPGPVVDVGSGAGLPGIPLAILRPERQVRLLEPRRRRAAFLEEAVRRLDLDCEVITMTAEEAAANPRLAAGHALATARALAPPALAFRLIEPLVAPGGTAAVFVGRHVTLPDHATEMLPGLAIVER